MTIPSTVHTDADRFAAAIARFDAANAEDPNRALNGGEARPKELLYAERMSEWLEAFAPGASEAVQLAARCQHIQRWTIRRAEFPEGKAGYKKWRTTLAQFHAESAGTILREVGYDAAMVERVGALLRKEKLKHDPDVQLLEDVICLVFLDYYFAEFITKHEDAKLVDIVRKTWRKMSDRGHEAALTIAMTADEARIVQAALQ